MNVITYRRDRYAGRMFRIYVNGVRTHLTYLDENHARAAVVCLQKG
jgi:hypothetical protein